MDSRILNSGEKILDRYEVIEVLGQGGMGVVYRCLDRVSDMMVAVKGLLPELAGDRDWMEEVKSNFRTVVTLRHSVIAGLRNIEQDRDGACYVVMDYVSGQDLPDYLASHELTDDNAFIILLDIADALDYAHDEGIIHRDVKPDNVRIGLDKSVKLLDLGIAARVSTRDARLTAGTPGYMAPEQKRGEPQSGATDEYSLAVMAYRMFYGQFPPDDLAFPKELSAKVRAVYAKALANDSKMRYRRCTGFVRDLALAMGVRSAARKSFGWLGWSIAAGLTLTLIVGGWFYHWDRSESARAIETRDDEIFELNSQMGDMDRKFRNATSRTEETMEQMWKDREDLLADHDRLVAGIKNESEWEQNRLSAQIDDLRRRIAKLEVEKAELARKLACRPSKDVVEMPPAEDPPVEVRQTEAPPAERNAAVKSKVNNKIKSVSEIGANESFTFSTWLTVGNVKAKARIFEFKYPEVGPDNQFCMYWGDDGKAVLQAGKSLAKVNCDFTVGETYHLVVTVDNSRPKLARIKVYVGNADDLAMTMACSCTDLIPTWSRLDDLKVGGSFDWKMPKCTIKGSKPLIVNRRLLPDQIQWLHDHGAPKEVRYEGFRSYPRAAVTNHFTVSVRLTPKGKIERFPARVGGIGVRNLDVRGPVVIEPAKPSVGGVAGLGLVVGVNGIVVYYRDGSHFECNLVAKRDLPERPVTLYLVSRGLSPLHLYLDDEFIGEGAGNGSAKFFDSTCKVADPDRVKVSAIRRPLAPAEITKR